MSGIPRSEYHERVRSVQKSLADRELDGLLAFSCYCEREGNVCYLTNHRTSFPPSNNDGSDAGWGYSAVLVGLDGEPTLMVTLGYREDAVVGVRDVKDGRNLPKMIEDAIRENHLTGKRLGVAGTDVIPWSLFEHIRKAVPSTSFEGADDLLMDLRMVKSANELEIMRAGAKIADMGMEACMKAAKDGVSELELGILARKVAIEAGADYVARDKVLSGPWSGKNRWPLTTSRKLRSGELLYVDFVGWHMNYAFDMLRTRVIGSGDENTRQLLAAARDSTDAMCEAVKAGVKVGDVYRTGMGCITKWKVQGAPFGHGIGIEVVERPVLQEMHELVLKPGMVLCIEPKITHKDLGSARFEDMVIVTESGHERITHCPTDF